MQPYLDLLSRVATRGVPKEGRTGTGTLSIFGAQVRSDLRDGFPLLTTRAINYRAAIEETRLSGRRLVAHRPCQSGYITGIPLPAKEL